MNKAQMLEMKEESKEVFKTIFEPKIKQALERKDLPKIYGTVRKVSRSGMNRKLDFFIIRNNELQNMNYRIGILTGYKRNKDGYLNVNGCGMDMLYHVVYSLGNALWTNEEAKALKFVSHRNGATTPEDQGGYLLNYEHF